MDDAAEQSGKLETQSNNNWTFAFGPKGRNATLPIEQAASLYQTQALPILQPPDRAFNRGIAQDELKHCEQFVLISPGPSPVVYTQDPLRFLNGGHHRLTI